MCELSEQPSEMGGGPGVQVDGVERLALFRVVHEVDDAGEAEPSGPHSHVRAPASVLGPTRASSPDNETHVYLGVFRSDLPRESM